MPYYCDWLWFDIDDPDLEVAQGKAMELLAQLDVRYEIKPDSVAPYLSVSKASTLGFHLAYMVQSPHPISCRFSGKGGVVKKNGEARCKARSRGLYDQSVRDESAACLWGGTAAAVQLSVRGQAGRE